MRRALLSLALFAGLLAARSPAAFAYEVKTTSSGALIRWAAGEIEVALDLGSRSSDVAAADAEEAVLGAFHAWGRRLEETLTFRFVSHQGEPLSHEPADGQNVVNWIFEDWERDYAPSALAVTRVTYKVESGAILEADIAVNAERHDWTISEPGADCRAYDLQNVTTHEVGHFLGLGHAEEQPAATMFPTSARCETQKRELAADDVAGLGALYPAAGEGAPGGSTGEGAPAERDYEEPITFGCAAAGGAARGAASGAVFALLLALVFLRRRRVGLAALLAAAVALPSVAGATAARRMDVGELATRSAAVVRGEVIAQRSFRRGDLIYTDSTLGVAECWKGTCPAEVVVRQLGGEHGELGMLVEGQATLAKGDRVVLFLRRRQDAALAPVGLAQGAFREVGGEEEGGSQPLVRDLRELSLVEGGEHSRGRLERWTAAELRRQVAATR